MAAYVTTVNAFTPVPARRSFVQPSSGAAHPSTNPPPTANGDKTKVDWPDSVRAYVQKAFAIENSLPNITKSDMEVRLKQIIASAVQDNTLWSTDWHQAPLPQQVIAEEQRSAKVDANPPWGTGVAPLNSSDANNKAIDLTPRKRKSSELEAQPTFVERVPPWRVANAKNVFESRLSYPDKRSKGDDAAKGFSKSQKRKQKFENMHSGFISQPNTRHAEPASPTEVLGPVVGRSQELEKKYFRLTSAPNPDTVRPLNVLEKTLELLKRKWKAEKNYSYICDQLKSLRQDLTVQHIKSSFTVSVYELHARIALEKGDLGEYNQCQTQLRALYSQRLGGHPEEFKAYRILYFIHTCNRSDMNDVLADLTLAEKQHSAVKHALLTRSALALGNYHRFFQLYLETPNMGAYLLDMFVNRERLVALSNLCISYKPDIKLRFVTEELGFESDDESARFICDHGGQTYLEEHAGGDVKLLTGKALRFFEAAKIAAFKTVDIKGQI